MTAKEKAKEILKLLSIRSKKEKLTPEQQKAHEEDRAYFLLLDSVGHYYELGKTLDEVIEIVENTWQDIEEAVAEDN